MESIPEDNLFILNAPPEICADTIVSLVMAKTVKDLLDNTSLADETNNPQIILGNTKFIVNCGIIGCQGRRVLSTVGREDKLFIAPSHSQTKLGSCQNITAKLTA